MKSGRSGAARNAARQIMANISGKRMKLHATSPGEDFLLCFRSSQNIRVSVNQKYSLSKTRAMRFLTNDRIISCTPKPRFDQVESPADITDRTVSTEISSMEQVVLCQICKVRYRILYHYTLNKSISQTSVNVTMSIYIYIFKQYSPI